VSILDKYFSGLPAAQIQLLHSLKGHYEEWNSRINLISRRDMIHFEERHLLFSLAVARLIPFRPGSRIIDVGTGGGFPGLPLAIIFPECSFVLLDSVCKKILAVERIVSLLGLTNITTLCMRAERHRASYDYILGRAVSSLPLFISQTKHLLITGKHAPAANGYLYLGGGEMHVPGIKTGHIREFSLSSEFEEPYFETKKLVYINYKALTFNNINNKTQKRSN